VHNASPQNIIQPNVSQVAALFDPQPASFPLAPAQPVPPVPNHRAAVPTVVAATNPFSSLAPAVPAMFTTRSQPVSQQPAQDISQPVTPVANHAPAVSAEQQAASIPAVTPAVVQEFVLANPMLFPPYVVQAMSQSLSFTPPQQPGRVPNLNTPQLFQPLGSSHAFASNGAEVQFEDQEARSVHSQARSQARSLNLTPCDQPLSHPPVREQPGHSADQPNISVTKPATYSAPQCTTATKFRENKSSKKTRNRLPSDPEDSDDSSSDSSSNDGHRRSCSRRGQSGPGSDSGSDDPDLPHPRYNLEDLKSHLSLLRSQQTVQPPVLSLSNGEQVWNSITKSNATPIIGDQGINYLNYQDDITALLGQAVQATVMGGTHLSTGAVLLTVERQTSRVVGHEGRRWLTNNLPDLLVLSRVYDQLTPLQPETFNALAFWKVYVTPRLDKTFLKANVGDVQRIKAMTWGVDPHGKTIPNATPKSFFLCWYNYWKIVGAGKHILITEFCSIIYAKFVAKKWNNFDYDKLSDLLRSALNSPNRAFDCAKVLKGLENLWRPVISAVDHDALFPKPAIATGYRVAPRLVL